MKAQQPINNRSRHRQKQPRKLQQTRTEEHSKSSDNKQGQQHEHEQQINKSKKNKNNKKQKYNKYSNPYIFIKQQCESAGKIAHKQVSSLYHHQNLCSTCFSTKRESSLFELHVKRGSHDPRWTWNEFGTRRGWEPLLDANGTCKAWKLWPHQELHACRNSFWIIQEYSRIKAESNTLPWHDASKLL